VAALKGPQEEIVKMVDELRKRRNVMIDELNRIEGIRCIRPFGGLFAFPDVSEMDLSEDELVSYLAEEAHVFCVPGSAFGENGRGHIRLTYALPHEKMVSGLKRMHETIAHAKITRRR
jgi:aminotransferase